MHESSSCRSSMDFVQRLEFLGFLDFLGGGGGEERNKEKGLVRLLVMVIYSTIAYRFLNEFRLPFHSLLSAHRGGGIS